MNHEEVLGILADCGAFLQGHFLLSSGLHSPGYFQCALACQHPDTCARLCADLAKSFADTQVDAVIAPAVGGIVIAYELARALGVRGLFMERDSEERMILRRGFTVEAGERVVVAEDVMTTGGSVAEIVGAVECAGAEVVGIACLVDRGGSKRFKGRRVASLISVDLPVYPPEDCPLCKQGPPLVKPGTRKEPGA